MEGNLVFNIGLDEVRGYLFDGDGAKVGAFKRDIGLRIDEEYAEQDPNEWYAAVTYLIGEVLEKFPDIRLNSISAGSIPGTVVFVDNAGDPVADAIVYCDCRARYQDRIFEKNFRRYDDDFHIPWRYMALPKILWLKYNRPDLYNSIFRILTPEAYLSYRLCGEADIDSYTAAFFGYDTKSSSYNTKLLSGIGIDVRLLPQVGNVGECAGMIAGEARERLGLKYDVRFILSSNSIINLSRIQQRKNHLFYDAGSSLIIYMNGFAKVRRDSELIRLPAMDKGSFVYCYIGSGEMRFLKYIVHSGQTSDSYAPGSGGLLVLPYMLCGGEASLSDERCSILGVNENTGDKDVAAAFYESVGYMLKDRINRLLSLGYPVESVEIASEITDELFFKVVSDITARRVIINDDGDSCILGAYSASSGNAYDHPGERAEHLPDESAGNIYDRFYSLYWSAFNSLLDVYRYRRRILRRIAP